MYLYNHQAMIFQMRVTMLTRRAMCAYPHMGKLKSAIPPLGQRAL
jgi:hypothetical protein